MGEEVTEDGSTRGQVEEGGERRVEQTSHFYAVDADDDTLATDLSESQAVQRLADVMLHDPAMRVTLWSSRGVHREWVRVSATRIWRKVDSPEDMSPLPRSMVKRLSKHWSCKARRLVKEPSKAMPGKKKPVVAPAWFPKCTLCGKKATRWRKDKPRCGRHFNVNV